MRRGEGYGRASRYANDDRDWTARANGIAGGRQGSRDHPRPGAAEHPYVIRAGLQCRCCALTYVECTDCHRSSAVCCILKANSALMQMPTCLSYGWVARTARKMSHVYRLQACPGRGSRTTAARRAAQPAVPPSARRRCLPHKRLSKHIRSSHPLLSPFCRDFGVAMQIGVAMHVNKETACQQSTVARRQCMTGCELLSFCTLSCAGHSRHRVVCCCQRPGVHPGRCR